MARKRGGAEPASDQEPDWDVPEAAYDDFDEEANESEPVEIPVPDDYYDDLEPDQLDYDSEWEDNLEDLAPDLARSRRGERGCLVAWHCRLHPAPNELLGCEESCVWTRNSDAARPNCFGIYGGQGLVSPGEPLYEVVIATCRRCLHQRACAAEFERRNPGREATLPSA